MCVSSCVRTRRSQSSVAPMKSVPDGHVAVIVIASRGTGVAQPLSPRDREIAEALGPGLKAAGLLLVGLDIIGDWLTEVNVTSPTCMREIADQTGFNVAALMIDALERLPP